MDIQAEVSLYPLGESHFSGSIEAFVEALEEHGCHTEVEDMKELGVRAVAPSHCSGDTARKLFQKRYGAGYHPAAVGWTKRFQAPNSGADATH